MTGNNPTLLCRYPWERGEAAWLLLGSTASETHEYANAEAGSPTSQFSGGSHTLRPPGGAPARGPPGAWPAGPLLRSAGSSGGGGGDSPPRRPGCLGGRAGGDLGIKEEEDAAAEDEDLPAAALADADSRFLDLGGLTVHYKEALPPVRPAKGVAHYH